MDGGSYFNKRDNPDWYNPMRPFLLTIQNPRSPEDDVSRNSYAVEAIRRAFKHAYYVLTANFWKDGQYLGRKRNHKTILSWIIKLPREVVYYRHAAFVPPRPWLPCP